MSRWWEADRGAVNTQIMSYVSEIERKQGFIFERFHRLGALYDPYFAFMSGYGWMDPSTPRYTTGFQDDVSENVIASTVDSVTAIIAATEVRARFIPDEGDWTAQRQARHLEWYAEGLGKLLRVHEVAVQCFRDAALKGTGLAKIYVDPATQAIRVDRVLIDDIIVDEGECRTSSPRQIHHRVFVDREDLKAAFPESAEAIDRMGSSGSMSSGSWRLWAEYRPLTSDQVVVVESWRLPSGAKAKGNYVPGRHTICIMGHDLCDDEWHKPFFPFARITWTDRNAGWYGIGAAERIAGHQRRINRLHVQIDRQQDQLAFPTTYVRMADANLAVKTTSRVGTIVPFKGEVPKTVIPPAVSPETYARLQLLAERAYEEVGLSRLAATAKKPAGLDSGVALREYRDLTTQRFARQERAFEQLFLDVTWLMIDCAKDLGSKAPVVFRRSRWGAKKIEWGRLDMTDVRVQIAAASTIARTPAGRMQMILEWAQAGVISQDEARRLLRHPDLERAMSLYTAALEDLERTIEEILDGAWLTPEPYQALKMGVWRFTQAMLLAKADGAPEEILEALRQWIVQAAYILSVAETPPMPDASLAGAMPAELGPALPVPGAGAEMTT